MSDASTIQQRFVEAWTAISNPELDGENPHYGNQFATLRSTLEAVRGACEGRGIAYLQRLVRADDGKCELRSSILSDDGKVMKLSAFPVEAPPNPQSFGSNITYAKRQQAQADWGITGEHDDDGEAGANAVSSKRPAPVDKALMDARQRLWNAIKAYAEAHGADPKEMAKGVEKRPDYANTTERLTMIAEEFESELNVSGA